MTIHDLIADAIRMDATPEICGDTMKAVLICNTTKEAVGWVDLHTGDGTFIR